VSFQGVKGPNDEREHKSIHIAVLTMQSRMYPVSIDH